MLSDKALQCVNKARSIGWDPGLFVIKELLNKLGNPQNDTPAVHVTGTNGKGSVCAFLNSICMSAGIRVGRFTSPAVDSEYERYTIDDEWILEQDYSELLEQVADAALLVEQSGLRYPSLFEVETALAFLYFKKKQCQLMIIEVGMGGLKDATNVMERPIECLFTNIGLEHMQWLGNSLYDIAANKAGIIKPGCQVVTAVQEPEALRAIVETAETNGCPFSVAEPLESGQYILGLNGTFQLQNAALAKCAALKLNDAGFKISDSDIENGLKDAVWPFRFEKICDNPAIILDGAHNPPAIRQLKRSITENYKDAKLTFVVSVLKDKDFSQMFEDILPLASQVVVAQAPGERALELDSLYSVCHSVVPDCLKAYNYREACQLALNSQPEAIICFGTFTYLREIRNNFREILNVD